MHTALLALVLLGFASAPRFADNPEAIPIETVSLSDLNQIMNGEKDAKPAPAPAPPAPPPDLRASAEPTPPPPAPTPRTKPEAAPQPKSAKAEASPPKPAPQPDATAPEPMPPERPEPTPTPKLAMQEAPEPMPPIRPKFLDAPPERPKEPAPDKPRPSHNFDPSAIAKLIGEGKMSTPSMAPAQTAATPQGLPHHDAPRMSISMASALDAWLTESYLNCWSPPPTTPDGDTYVAEIKVVFNSDGSLAGARSCSIRRPTALGAPMRKARCARSRNAIP